MAKKLTIIGVIVAVIGALLAALYILNQPDPNAVPEYSLPDVRYVIGGSPAPVPASIEVRNEKDSYTFINEKPSEPKSAVNYKLKGFEEFACVSYPVSNLVDRSSSMIMNTLIIESGADLAAFGLDKPRAAADIVYADGSAATLLIGAAAGTEGVYVMKKDDPAVYLVLSTYVEPFFKTSLDYLDTQVTSGHAEVGPNGEPASSFTSATLAGTVRPEPISIRATPETQIDTGSGVMLNTHEIYSPLQVRLHIERGLAVIQSVFGLQADHVEAWGGSPETLAKYGLDNPYSTIEADSPEEGRIKLLASAPNPTDNTVFIKRDGVDLIYRVSVDSVPWLESQIFNLMDTMIVLPFIDKISSVTVSSPELSATFTLTGVESDLAVSENGQPVDLKNFKAYYQTLLAASYDSVTDEIIPVGTTPILEFTYRYRESSNVESIKFYPAAAARKVLVSYNGGSPFYVLSTYSDRVKTDLRLLLAGEKVTSYL